MVGTSATILGTLSRYKDSTLSVTLGAEQVSVAVTLDPVDPGGPEVVQFTYKIYDTTQTPGGRPTSSTRGRGQTPPP